jgi:hypothetical protein
MQIRGWRRSLKRNIIKSTPSLSPLIRPPVPLFSCGKLAIMSRIIDETIISEEVLPKYTAESSTLPIDPDYDNSKEKGAYSTSINAADSTDRGNATDEPQYDFTSEEFANIPELVQEVVGFEDDPTLPVLTFRSFLLAAFFCIVGSIVSQIS